LGAVRKRVKAGIEVKKARAAAMMRRPPNDVTLTAMREDVPNSAAFPTAHCEPCGKSVLTYVALDADNAEVRCCVHCDGVVVEALRWLNASELEAEGYEIGYRPREEKSGGCGSGGCGSCATRK
jgi:hypothetical protein